MIHLNALSDSSISLRMVLNTKQKLGHCANCKRKQNAIFAICPCLLKMFLQSVPGPCSDIFYTSMHFTVVNLAPSFAWGRRSFIPNHDTITCKQLTCLPAESSNRCLMLILIAKLCVWHTYGNINHINTLTGKWTYRYGSDAYMVEPVISSRVTWRDYP